MLLSLLTWIVFVHAVSVVILGNPACRLVRNTPALVLAEAVTCLEDDISPHDDRVAGPCHEFMRRFFRLSMIYVFVFFLEAALTLYFLFTEPLFLVPWFVWVKNMAMLYAAYTVHRHSSNNLFEAVQEIPPWAMRWERISYMLTAVCFGLLFLKANFLL